MATICRVCLYDEAGSKETRFHVPFVNIEHVAILGVFDAWDPLHDALIKDEAEVLAINLDGPQALDIVKRATQQVPELGVIGISKQTDATFIIKAMRAGCGQFVCWPVDGDDLKNALSRVRPLPMMRTGQSASKLVCVVGSSGGTGATAIACNLAIELSHLTNDRTALVDLNLEFGDVCSAFDAAPRYSIADICGDGIQIDRDAVTATMQELPCRVCILGRPENVEEARDVTPDGLERMFKLMADEFNHIIVDLPRASSFLSTVAVERADFVLVVCQLAVPSIRNAARVYQALQQMGAREDRLHIVVNRYNAEFERLTLKDVERHFRRPVFAVVPNDYRYVSASLDLGHPIGADSPTSRARSAIQEIAAKIAPEHVNAKTIKSKEGFLARLLPRREG